MNCPECECKNYLVWPSRKNCQTCLKLRVENLERSFAKHAAARAARSPQVSVVAATDAAPSPESKYERFTDNSRSSDAK